jgi:hypothetical protein
MEEWRDIPGFEGRYQVSDLGRVRSLDHRVRLVAKGVETTRLSPSRVLRPAPHKSGHLMVMLGRKNNKDVHVLVARAFIGDPPPGHEVMHANHTPSDNRLSNLSYGTRSENLKADYAAGNRSQKRAKS